MCAELQKHGEESKRPAGGFHCKRACSYAKFAGAAEFHNWHMQKYGRAPNLHVARPTIAKGRSKMSRWTVKDLKRSVQELEDENDELRMEMNNFATAVSAH